MDEVKYKLRSNNVMIVSEAISLLINQLMKAMQQNNNSATVDQYLHLLHEKCVTSDPLVSSIACSGILKLIENRALDINSALSTTMSMLYSINTYSGLATILSGILTVSVSFDVQMNKGKYECRWRITNPVHPLILVIQQKNEATKEVVRKMEFLSSSESHINEYALELLRPVFIWILCNKKESFSHLEQNDTLNIILNYKDNKDKLCLLFECLVWQEINQIGILSTFQFYSLTLKWALNNNKLKFVYGLIPNFANIAHELILAGENPKPCFNILLDLIERCEDRSIISCTLGLLAKTLLTCPVSYIPCLLSLCLLCCQKNNCKLVDYMLIVAILQWEYNKNFLTQDFDETLKKILNIILQKCYQDSFVKSDNDYFHILKSVNNKTYNIYEFCLHHNKIVGNENEFSGWLEKWKLADSCSKIECQLYIQALLLLPNDINEYQKINLYSIAMDLIEHDYESAIGQLPITLYFMKKNTNPKLTVELMKSIPVLASVKENVSTVIHILKSLTSKNNVPKSFLIELYTILYRNQSRCYSLLQTIVAQSLCESQDPKFIWEILISQAKAVKYICEVEAEIHGMNLVPVLTESIRQSQENNCPVACCLTLDTFRLLMEKQIIDPISTWKILGPQFHDEKNPNIKASVCNLLSVTPLLYLNEPEFNDFMDRVILKLWEYTNQIHGSSVNIAAFSALSKFRGNMFLLKQIPSIYKDGIVIPSNAIKVNSEEKPNPEDFLNYIPSIVWSNIFKNANSDIMPGVIQLCYTLMNNEISSYRSGIYELSMGEPNSAKCLPNASVVRGVLEFLRKEVLSISNNIVNPNIIDCIKCLSMPFEKPLPPLNWGFLSLLCNDDMMLTLKEKLLIMKFIGKLSENSQSAVKLLTMYLESLNGIYKIEDLQILSEILPNVLKVVKSGTYSPIVENCFKQYFSMLSIDDKSNIHIDLLKSTSLCLNNQDIKDNTKDVLWNFLLNFWKNFDINNHLWPEVVNVYCCLPYELIGKITNSLNEKSYELYKKLAFDYEHSENPLDCLHELIDLGIINRNETENIVNLLIAALINAKTDLDSTKTWVLRLKTRIEVYMNSNDAKTDASHFLLDVMFLSVIIFSNHYILSFYDHKELQSVTFRCNVFPQAVRLFINRSEEWKNVACLLIEWMHFCRDSHLIDEDYKKAMNKTLLLCLPCINFQEQYIWAKYLSTKIYDVLPSI